MAETLADIIGRLAPYPLCEEDATADRLARYYAASAQACMWRIGSAGEAIAVVAYVHAYTLASVLRAFKDAAPVLADQAARSACRALDAGEMTGEQLWDWLIEWGIDPDELAPDYVSEQVVELPVGDVV